MIDQSAIRQLWEAVGSKDARSEPSISEAHENTARLNSPTRAPSARRTAAARRQAATQTLMGARISSPMGWVALRPAPVWTTTVVSSARITPRRSRPLRAAAALALVGSTARTRKTTEGSLRASIENEVQRLLPRGEANTATVAKALALSARTLSRRLARTSESAGVTGIS